MSIESISPIDGRYSSKVTSLIPYFSEKALISYRIFVEANYLMHLSKTVKIGLREFSREEIKFLSNLHLIDDDNAKLVKLIETKGYKEIPATNHDVKACEYYIKIKLAETSLRDVLEFVHFALTSEDINNIAYSLMMRDSFNQVIFNDLINLYDYLYNLAISNKDIPMLARTHGQPASPTTFGKEVIFFVNRLKEEFSLFSNIPLMVKLNGATGNFNAHSIVFPEIDWQAFSMSFVERLNTMNDKTSFKHYNDSPLKLKYNPITTQIEPHDSFARLFDSMKRINTILIDFCQDIWRYISDSWITQKPVKGEIGSSAMPHKVNPIDFENAEGNLGIANSLFTFFSSKLSISRLQRDLSDSTVQRNIGVAFAHSYVAYQSILKGLTKIEVNDDKLLSILQNNPEVIAEAFQNILRAEGVEKPYELLKDLTRGKKVTADDYNELIKNINIDDRIKQKILSKSIKPETYIGIASRIVEEFNPDIF